MTERRSGTEIDALRPHAHGGHARHGGRFPSIVDAIGFTPLVEVPHVCPNPNVRLYAKLEFMNPMGSVKDRIGASMIGAAEEAGLIGPGRPVRVIGHRLIHGGEEIRHLLVGSILWVGWGETAKTALIYAALGVVLAVAIGANIGGPHDTAVALDYGAEGVGLFRTEFLFLDRQTAPSEEEQVAAYDKVAQAMGDRPVIIRTLDVGGDKFLSPLEYPQEMNPALGLRAIRFCLKEPGIFRSQLKAILRASAHGQVRIMFPLISSIQEMREARRLLQEIQQELALERQAFHAHLRVKNGLSHITLENVRVDVMFTDAQGVSVPASSDPQPGPGWLAQSGSDRTAAQP